LLFAFLVGTVFTKPLDTSKIVDIGLTFCAGIASNRLEILWNGNFGFLDAYVIGTKRKMGAGV
jgi:hypothetical protein